MARKAKAVKIAKIEIGTTLAVIESTVVEPTEIVSIIDESIEVVSSIEIEDEILDAPVRNMFSGLGQRVDLSTVVDVEIKESSTKIEQPEVVTNSTSKSTLARAIFDQCYKMNPVPQRKDIINRAMQEAGLTKAGAATYLQNYKAKNGLTHQK